jgi:trans-aconitate methyltransferase
MSTLGDSWGAFSADIASKYLKSYGHPSLTSKKLLVDVLKECAQGLGSPTVIDLGCGNAQIGEYFLEEKFDCTYTGVDFSDVLLEVARRCLPSGRFIKDDVNTLAEVSGHYDFAIYSHVVELLSSPEDSLAAASKLAKTVVIRFYEPPEFERDSTELRWMEVDEGRQVPFLRRKMSRDYYSLILAKVGCKQVDIFRDSTKDQVHVLRF